MTSDNPTYANRDGFCPHGFFVIDGECVFCEFGESVRDGHCDKCNASTWHLPLHEKMADRCLACGDEHQYVPGVLTRGISGNRE